MIKWIKFFILSLFLTTCHFSESSKDEAEWNVLFYLAADNDLEKSALQILKDIKSVGSSDKINCLVLFDSYAETKLFNIRKKGADFTKDEIFNFGELDMTDPKTLKMFLNYAKTKYPASKTSLIIYSHGQGIYPEGILTTAENFQMQRSVIADFTTSVSSECSMSIIDLANVLRDEKIDLLFFDSCYMAMQEVFWELDDCTNYIIASETESFVNILNYGEFLEQLKNNPEMTDYEMSFMTIDLFLNKKEKNTSTVVAVNMEKFLDYEKCFKDFVEELFTLDDSLITKIIEDRKKLFKFAWNFEDYCDLEKWLLTFDEFEQSKIKLLAQNACDALLNSIERKIIIDGYESKLGGVATNIPVNDENYKNYIRESGKLLKIYKDTYFNDFILSIN